MAGDRQLSIQSPLRTETEIIDAILADADVRCSDMLSPTDAQRALDKGEIVHGIVAVAEESDMLVYTDDNPHPYPPPPDGAPILATLRSDSSIALRHFSGPNDAPSPIATLSVQSHSEGCTIELRMRPYYAGWPVQPGFLRRQFFRALDILFTGFQDGPVLGLIVMLWWIVIGPIWVVIRAPFRPWLRHLGHRRYGDKLTAVILRAVQGRIEDKKTNS